MKSESPEAIGPHPADGALMDVSIRHLIGLYGAWNKPEKANEFRAKLPQTEAARE
jgi:hypothetical protein